MIAYLSLGFYEMSFIISVHITFRHWTFNIHVEPDKIRNSFIHKNGNRRYKFLVWDREGPYFVREHSNSKSKYTEEDIIGMLEFLVDNIFGVFAGKVLQQIIGIPMGTNCAPLPADICLYSYEAKFIQSLLSTGRKRLAFQFNSTYWYRYIDDVLSINNPEIISVRSIPLNLRSKTRQRATILLPTWIYSYQSVETVNFTFPFYNKRDVFNFHITNFPFLGSNIPSSPAHGVFISQFIR